MLAYLLVHRGAALVWLLRRQSRDPLLDNARRADPVRLLRRQLFRLAEILRHLSLHHRARRCWRRC